MSHDDGYPARRLRGYIDQDNDRYAHQFMLPSHHHQRDFVPSFDGQNFNNNCINLQYNQDLQPINDDVLDRLDIDQQAYGYGLHHPYFAPSGNGFNANALTQLIPGPYCNRNIAFGMLLTSRVQFDFTPSVQGQSFGLQPGAFQDASPINHGSGLPPQVEAYAVHQTQRMMLQRVRDIQSMQHMERVQNLQLAQNGFTHQPAYTSSYDGTKLAQHKHGLPHVNVSLQSNPFFMSQQHQMQGAVPRQPQHVQWVASHGVATHRSNHRAIFQPQITHRMTLPLRTKLCVVAQSAVPQWQSQLGVSTAAAFNHLQGPPVPPITALPGMAIQLVAENNVHVPCRRNVASQGDEIGEDEEDEEDREEDSPFDWPERPHPHRVFKESLPQMPSSKYLNAKRRPARVFCRFDQAGILNVTPIEPIEKAL